MSKKNTHDELLSVSEAAARLSVSPNSIRNWAREGRVTLLKIGPKCARIPSSEVVRLLDEARAHEQ